MLLKNSLSVGAVLALANVCHALVPRTGTFTPARSLGGGPSCPYSPEYPIDTCPSGYLVVAQQVSQLTYPVVINQYFGNNTVININGGLTINNAPTSISSTFTVTTTTTVTTTAQGGAVTQAAPSTFLIEVLGSGVTKRDSGSSLFLGSGGSVGGCVGALQFSIVSSQLVSSDGGAFGASDVSTFAPLSAGGSTTTTFVSSGGSLVWQNTLFVPNGVATFCSSAGVVNAVFNGVIPTGCNPVSLILVDTALCAGSTSSSSVSSASTTATDSGTASGSASATSGTASSTDTASSSTGTASSTTGTASSTTGTGSTSASSSTGASSSSSTVSSSSSSSSGSTSSTTSGSSSTTSTSASATATPGCNGIPNAVVSSSGNGCVCAANYAPNSLTALTYCTQCGQGTNYPSGTTACACNTGLGNMGTLNGVTTCQVCGTNTYLSNNNCVCGSSANGASPGVLSSSGGTASCQVCNGPGAVLNQAGTQCICATGYGISTTQTSGSYSCIKCNNGAAGANGYCP